MLRMTLRGSRKRPDVTLILELLEPALSRFEAAESRPKTLEQLAYVVLPASCLATPATIRILAPSFESEAA
jgi:hypothetical protein